MIQARDLLTSPRPSQPPYMSCRESTRALHEPPAATFLDVTVMTGINSGPGEASLGGRGATDTGEDRVTPLPLFETGHKRPPGWSGR
jgi:hypothetical protein